MALEFGPWDLSGNWIVGLGLPTQSRYVEIGPEFYLELVGRRFLRRREARFLLPLVDDLSTLPAPTAENSTFQFPDKVQ